MRIDLYDAYGNWLKCIYQELKHINYLQYCHYRQKGDYYTTDDHVSTVSRHQTDLLSVSTVEPPSQR